MTVEIERIVAEVGPGAGVLEILHGGSLVGEAVRAKEMP